MGGCVLRNPAFKSVILKAFAAVAVWKNDQRGVTAVEYGLIAAGIAVVTSAVIFMFGESLRDMISDAGGKIEQRP